MPHRQSITTTKLAVTSFYVTSKTEDCGKKNRERAFTRIGKHLLLGRRDVVGAKTAEIKYMSSFILNTSPWVLMPSSEVASTVVLGMDAITGNKQANKTSSISLFTSYGTLISPRGTPKVQNTDSSSKGSLPRPGITNSLDSGSYISLI